jgi:ribosomal protein S18 acetylase RimI-like enzyme
LSTSLNIQKAKIADAAGIARLLNMLNASDANGMQHSIADAQNLIRKMDQNADHMNLRILVAQRADTLLGLLIAYEGFDIASMEYGLHIADLVVDEAARQQRIGHALLRAIATDCLAHNGAWMSLTCMKTNVIGHKFYQAFGFQPAPVQFYAIGKNRMRAI